MKSRWFKVSAIKERGWAEQSVQSNFLRATRRPMIVVLIFVRPSLRWCDCFDEWEPRIPLGSRSSFCFLFMRAFLSSVAYGSENEHGGVGVRVASQLNLNRLIDASKSSEVSQRVLSQTINFKFQLGNLDEASRSNSFEGAHSCSETVSKLVH